MVYTVTLVTMLRKHSNCKGFGGYRRGNKVGNRRVTGEPKRRKLRRKHLRDFGIVLVRALFPTSLCSVVPCLCYLWQPFPSRHSVHDLPDLARVFERGLTSCIVSIEGMVEQFLDADAIPATLMLEVAFDYADSPIVFHGLCLFLLVDADEGRVCDGGHLAILIAYSRFCPTLDNVIPYLVLVIEDVIAVRMDFDRKEPAVARFV